MNKHTSIDENSNSKDHLVIGVLAIQGGVLEHINHIKKLGYDAIEVKKIEDLEKIDGIILPGGESTAISKILRERNMLNPLAEAINKGLPAWGTCAGMILLAKEIEGEDACHLGVMDIRVKRNAYGSQLYSFVTLESIHEVCNEPLELIFIRAPYIVEVSKETKVIHKVGENIVAAKEKNILVTSFHPELSSSLEFHEYFIEKFVLGR
ncbi:pyridoxal 5'-phosphate synthase glutaminase subunit PdxT [Haloimpatiens lingqiaonensis]|uniref:pyridoxal 5'-phosphate synthase glutaminase subunit PdxT n=1 Tax=Haloimpatiens lingqiaonensis TaxID=1380675 RepID=UPI0037C11B87